MFGLIPRLQPTLVRSVPRAFTLTHLSKRPLSIFTRPTTLPALDAPTRLRRFAHSQTWAEPDSSKCLFVGRLPFKLSEGDLEAMFSEFGKVEQVKLVRYPSGQSRGCAFVQFVEEKSANAARERHEAEPFAFGAYTLRVQYAAPFDADGRTAKRSQERAEPETSNCLFIGQLPPETKEVDIWKALAEFGKVTKVVIPRRDGESRGIGFVEFENDESARAAREQHEKAPLAFYGSTVKVLLAKPFSEREKKPGVEGKRIQGSI